MKIIVDVKNAKKYFPINKSFLSNNRNMENVKAVDNVTLSIIKGETIGVVGESGSGKTTLGRLILHIYTPTEGNVIYNGVDISNISYSDFQPYKKKLQMIFQDPLSSLNPRMTVKDILEEPMRIHNLGTTEERDGKINKLLGLVGLHKGHKNRYPHEFSGGQRQRIGIARALATEPEVIVCDEPVSSLDVSIQAQIINLLKEMQSVFNLTYIFITHNIVMVRHISHRVAIMYMGKIVELMESDVIFKNPLHPYTKALISSVPQAIPKRKTGKDILWGEISTLTSLPSGCRFHPRCPLAEETCRQIDPALEEKEKNHFVACHRVSKALEQLSCMKCDISL